MNRFFLKGRFPMIRLCRFLPLVAGVVCAALLGAPTPARADFAVRVIDDGVTFNDTNHGGSIFAFVSGGPGSWSLIFAGTTTHFSLTNGSAMGNNPGTQGGSNLKFATQET